MAKNKQGVATSMNTIREILRLHYLGLSQRKIASAVKKGKTAIQRFVQKAEESGLNMELLEVVTDKELQEMMKFFPSRRSKTRIKSPIDFNRVSNELKTCKHVTMQLLWQEYQEKFPDSHYSYSSFCEQFKEWQSPLNATMRKNYAAGEYLFVDFSGSTIPYYDSRAKEHRNAQLFVATLGCSNYTYAQACESQDLKNWIRVHLNTFEFFGGVAKIIVPDNLKSGVTRSDRFDPDINQTYFEMAKHYSTAIVPARAHHPKDKAKVEGAVLIAQRWIMASLRKMQFFSIDEINQAISDLLAKMNEKPFKKLEGCRKTQFEMIEKPALVPLPEKRFEYCTFSSAKINIDYHVLFEQNYYSAPWKLIGKHVTIRATADCIELLFNHQRVASHVRTYQKWQNVTDDSHRPEKHIQQLKWNPDRLRSWAQNIGPDTGRLIHGIFDSCIHEDSGIKKVLGILSLSKKFTEPQLEYASGVALNLGCNRLKQIQRILEKIQDGNIEIRSEPAPTNDFHENVRGEDYYIKTDKSEVN